MSLSLGDNRIGRVYLGDEKVSRAYLGDSLVWSERQRWFLLQGNVGISGGEIEFLQPLAIALSRGAVPVAGKAIAYSEQLRFGLESGSIAVAGRSLGFASHVAFGLEAGSVPIVGDSLTFDTAGGTGPTDITLSNQTITTSDTVVGTLAAVGGVAPFTFEIV